MANMPMRMKYTAILDYARNLGHTFSIICYTFEMTDGKLGERPPILLSS